MTTDSRRRILKDLNRVGNESNLEVYAAPNEENIMECEAVIFGYFWKNNKVHKILHGKVALSSRRLSLVRSTRGKLLLLALWLKCFIQIVGIFCVKRDSLCWWIYLYGYFAKKVDSYAGFAENFDFDSGNFFGFLKFLGSLCWVIRILSRRRIWLQLRCLLRIRMSIIEWLSRMFRIVGCLWIMGSMRRCKYGVFGGVNMFN